MNINLLTVCTGKYPIKYAEKLVRQFERLTTFTVSPYCITDRPDKVLHFADALEPPFETVGWWNKMFCYSDMMPSGWNLYLDIDMVLCRNFDEEILYAIEQNQKVSCFSDAVKWCDNLFNSSFMVFKTGSMSDVYSKWLEEHESLHNYKGGDQVWTGRLLKETKQKILYLDRKYPKTKQSLKFQLGTRVGPHKYTYPASISKEVKIVDCNGNPKPDQLSSLSYIKHNWHDI